MAELESLIRPKSVAVIGASNDTTKVGYQIFNNLINFGFVGDVVPINPKYDQILDKKAYKDIKEYPDEIDLAVVVIPFAFVEDVLQSCAEKKVKAVIVISAGFGESGEEGKARQEKIKSLCQENGMTLLGPNCLGFINTNINLNASFALGMPYPGKVSVLSQSGAIISAIIDWSKTEFCGFSKIFSLGNKALLREADLLTFLYDDPETEVVALYVEQLHADSDLSKILMAKSKIKPTIVLYGGKTAFGATAAASHTGSIVSSYIAVKTYLEQLGVIVAADLRELFDLCKLFSSYKKIDGNCVAIVTNAGGPGIAASDSAFANGLCLPSLEPNTIEKIKAFLPAEASLKNPIDILGDADDKFYKNTLEIVLDDPNIDGVVTLLTPQTTTKIPETAEVIANIKHDKPIISSFVGAEAVRVGISAINKSGKPAYEYPEDAIKAMRFLYQYSTSKVDFELPENVVQKQLNLDQKNAALKEYGLPVLEYAEVQNEAELLGSANKVGYPVVLKIADANAHKSDSGGVVLNIQNDEELKTAFEKVGPPAIVGKMVKTEKELFLGVKKDQNIGTVITFGTGGIYAEIEKDFAYRIAPLSIEMAKKMISETKIGQIIAGARNQKQYDLEKLADLLVRASWFALEHVNISEIDFNPILASGQDYYIVDARIIIQ